MQKDRSKKINLSIVLPVYNEEAHIEKVIIEASKVAKRISNNFEILVVNDHSTDKTPEILKSLRIKQLKIVNHKKNLGIEKTLKELYSIAKNEFIFFNGADDDINMDVLLKLHQKILASNADIVVGNRIIKNYSLKRKIISLAYNSLVRYLIGVEVYDAGTVKLVKKKCFTNIKIDSKTVFGEAERLVRSVKNGAKIEKVDIKQNMNDSNDSVNYKEVFLSTVELFRLAYKVRFNKLN